MNKYIAIIGARPQFVKHFALHHAALNRINLLTIHTGQHYDYEMSQTFFDQLEIPTPDYFLNIGSGSHGFQTGNMLIEIEKILNIEKPQGVIVYGDTNSTIAGALAASKLNISVFHIEAGLRSFNRVMPEEINRILTDAISDLLFAPTQEAVNNLKHENAAGKIILAGDIMYDALLHAAEIIKGKQVASKESSYYYSTIHRPYNTDHRERLTAILEVLNKLDRQVIFSIHPRTKKMVQEFGIHDGLKNIQFISPQPYLDNIRYMQNADAVITDSGGVQKEAYLLQKKCLTIRSETEWVETLTHGWNQLVFEDLDKLQTYISKTPGEFNPFLYGNGKTAVKIVDEILAF